MIYMIYIIISSSFYHSLLQYFLLNFVAIGLYKNFYGSVATCTHNDML